LKLRPLFISVLSIGFLLWAIETGHILYYFLAMFSFGIIINFNNIKGQIYLWYNLIKAEWNRGR